MATRSSRSGWSRNCADMPWRTSPPFCMRLLTNRMCPPPRAGKREARKAKPLICPLTRNWPRVPQILATSKGMRMMVQPSRDWMLSSVARKVFATDLSLGFIAHRVVLKARGADSVLLRSRGRDGTGPFLDDVEGVDAEIVEFFEEAAGPADFDPIDFRGGAETKVDAHIVVGDEAGAAAHFVDEDAGAGFHADARANSVAIRFRADGAESHPMIGGAHFVNQK